MPEKQIHNLYPLFQNHPLARVALWHIDALKQEGLSPAMWLTEGERAEVAEYKNERRRHEWLTSRIALKRLLLEDGIVISPLHAEIRKNPLGCPRVFIRNPDSATPVEFACSLAHKNVLVIAGYALQGAHIGIDIERRSWRIQRIRKRFVSASDAMIETQDSIGHYTTLWTFKEATSKLLGVGYACGFTKVTCREKTPGVCEVTTPDKTTLQGHYMWMDNYVIALVTEPWDTAVSNPVEPAADFAPASQPARPWYKQWRRARRLRRLRRLRALAKISKPLDDPHGIE